MTPPEEVQYREVTTAPPGQNPNRTSTGRFASNESGTGGGGGNAGGGGGGGNTGSNNSRTRESQLQESQTPSQPQNNKESPMHSHLPAVIAASPFATPYGFPGYPGYGVPPVAPASNIVVAGSDGHGNGTHSQLETLSDIALGGLRESAAAGRTNQISNQIEGIGDRLDTQAGFARELNVSREFTAAQKDRGDLENRLLTAIKDESIRTRDMFTDQRIRELETRNADLRDARRDDRLMDVLGAIAKKLGA